MTKFEVMRQTCKNDKKIDYKVRAGNSKLTEDPDFEFSHEYG